MKYCKEHREAAVEMFLRKGVKKVKIFFTVYHNYLKDNAVLVVFLLFFNLNRLFVSFLVLPASQGTCCKENASNENAETQVAKRTDGKP